MFKIPRIGCILMLYYDDTLSYVINVVMMCKHLCLDFLSSQIRFSQLIRNKRALFNTNPIFKMVKSRVIISLF